MLIVVVLTMDVDVFTLLVVAGGGGGVVLTLFVVGGYSFVGVADTVVVFMTVVVTTTSVVGDGTAEVVLADVFSKQYPLILPCSVQIYPGTQSKG